MLGQACFSMKEHRPFIPHSRPTLGEEEIRAVAKVISSGHVAEGPVARRFEKQFAQRLNVPHAIATSSGTAALHLALLALGVQPQDEVIIPSFVCSALLHAVRYLHAVPVLAEIDLGTYNLSVEDVAARITSRTKAMIVPHMFGKPAAIKKLLAFHIPIIEDCAQSLGAVHERQPVGTFGRIAVFSFYATKVIATGEGGMVATSSAELAERVRDLKTYDKRTDDQTRYNYKLTDLQAAIGLAQFSRLDELLRARRRIAARYDRAFEGLNIGAPAPDDEHIYYRYVIQPPGDLQSWIGELRRNGIGCERPVYRPLHRCLGRDDYPFTERAWLRCLSLPIYPSLTDAEADRLIEEVFRLTRQRSS
jgi:perosamine synthetase